MKKYISDSNNKVVLLLNIKIHGSPITNANLFVERGYNVYELFFTSGISRCNLFQRIKNRFGFSVKDYITKKRYRYSKRVIEIVRKIRPQIVYVVQGTQLNKYAIDFIKGKSFLALRLIDRVSLFPEIKPLIGLYDYSSTYSEEDAIMLESQGAVCKYLPSNSDHSIFRKLHCKKDIDVSFVGAMYSDRIKLLEQLVNDMPYVNFKIYGEYAPIRKPKMLFKWLTNKRIHNCFTNKKIQPVKVNEIYNRSKICLNKNRTNAGSSWAGRFADIVSTKSFQLVNYSENLESIFHDYIGIYKDYEDLKAQILFYLSNDDIREKMAKACYSFYYNKVNGFTYDRLDLLLFHYNNWEKRKKSE